MCQGSSLSITGAEVRDSLSKIDSHTLASEAKHRADLRTPQEVCNSSIQENDSSALKPLGVVTEPRAVATGLGYAVVPTA